MNGVVDDSVAVIAGSSVLLVPGLVVGVGILYVCSEGTRNK